MDKSADAGHQLEMTAKQEEEEKNEEAEKKRRKKLSTILRLCSGEEIEKNLG